jgi:hypothetical protein
MKANNPKARWKEADDRKVRALQRFLRSNSENARAWMAVRGAFLIGQALSIAIEALEAEEHPPLSNISDMRALRAFYPQVAANLKAAQR